MNTITVRSPDYCRPYIRPHPNGMHGVYRLSYMTAGAPCLPYDGPLINPGDVAGILDQLQDILPLGIIGDYEVLCTGWQLLGSDDPAMGPASGVRAPGWIALSGMPKWTLRDLLGHELGHELEARMSAPEVAEFWRLVGQEPGDPSNWQWELRPQERLAEYLSAAIWSLEQDQRMPALPPETLVQVREWAMPILGRFGRARVVLDTTGQTEQPEPAPALQGIVLEPGSKLAWVNGSQVVLDVAPVIIDGRTMVPIRFVAESLGRQVDWDGRRVYIR